MCKYSIYWQNKCIVLTELNDYLWAMFLTSHAVTVTHWHATNHHDNQSALLIIKTVDLMYFNKTFNKVIQRKLVHKISRNAIGSIVQ